MPNTVANATNIIVHTKITKLICVNCELLTAIHIDKKNLLFFQPWTAVLHGIVLSCCHNRKICATYGEFETNI